MKLIQPIFYLLDVTEKEMYEIEKPEELTKLQPNQLLSIMAKNFNTENQEAAAIVNMFYFVNHKLKQIYTSKRLEWQAKTSTQSVYYRMILYLYGKEISVLRQLDPEYFDKEILFQSRLRYYQVHIEKNVGMFEMFYCIE